MTPGSEVPEVLTPVYTRSNLLYSQVGFVVIVDNMKQNCTIAEKRIEQNMLHESCQTL